MFVLLILQFSIQTAYAEFNIFLRTETPEEEYLMLLKMKTGDSFITDLQITDKTLLIETVKQGFYSSVEYVLTNDYFVNHINDRFDQSVPPLFWALFNGNKDITELLLRNGADPNFITENGLSAYESIDEFVAKQFISQMKAYELKQMLQDFGYGNVNLDKYYINENHILRDSFELRTVELLSSPIVTTLQKGSSVKIKILGKYETIDGIKNRWVYIETQETAKDRDGKELKTGTCGWCFGGYLE